MIYTARDLPAWVRFRPVVREREQYTVQTLSQYMIRQMIEATIASRVGRLAASVTSNNALLQRLTAANAKRSAATSSDDVPFS